jgi:hypothetical protein
MGRWIVLLILFACLERRGRTAKLFHHVVSILHRFLVSLSSNIKKTIETGLRGKVRFIFNLPYSVELP